MSTIFQGPRFPIPPNSLFQTPYPAAASQVSQVGDLMYWDGTNCRPLSYFTGLGTQPLDQAAIAQTFLGAATQGRIAAQTIAGGPPNYPAAGIEIASDCPYEANCASATFVTGDLVGVVSAAAGVQGDISDISVVAVTNQNLAIGQVLFDYAAATTRVRIQLWGKRIQPQSLVSYWSRLPVITSYAVPDANTTLTVATMASSLLCVPTAARNLILPDVAKSKGCSAFVINNSAGANTVTVQNAAAATVVAVPQNKRAIVWSDGTAWYGMLGA